MAAQLGQTANPVELVPGDAEAVSVALWLIRGYGDSLLDAGQGLARINTSDGWRGSAADAFREVFDGQPAKWTEAGDSFHSVADALERYTGSLTWAQAQAAEAIKLWDEGEAETARARQEHDAAVRRAVEEADARSRAGTPTAPAEIPFRDTGEPKRQAAREVLDRARTGLVGAGNEVAAIVVRERDKAPEKPGFWSKVGDAVGDALGKVGDGLLDAGANAVNAAASFGNAMINHPGDVAALAGGLGLTAISAAGDGLGIALDATGVGAVAGVPLNVVSTAGVVAGATVVAAATGDLTMHAMSDDKVSPVQRDEGGSGSATGGSSGRVYEASPKHGTAQRGNAAPAPTNGQEALERSVPIKETTPRRVSADPKTGELVVYDETYPGSGIYHGHVRPWNGPDGLSPSMQAALRKAGLVNSKGKVLGP
jgi:hypothetical protein